MAATGAWPVTSPLLRFPDVQEELVYGLEFLAGAGHTDIETPANLADMLDFIRVVRRGGPSDRLNDTSAVDIDVFAATYKRALNLAEDVREFVVGPPPGLPRLDRASCDNGPQELPWGDRTIRRIGMTFTVVARRRLVLA